MLKPLSCLMRASYFDSSNLMVQPHSSGFCLGIWRLHARFGTLTYTLDHPDPVNKAHGVGTKRAVNALNRPATHEKAGHTLRIHTVTK